MDAKLKATWVKALRSGKYKQARWKLTKGKNHHCCIGVCAVLVNKDAVLSHSTGSAAALIGINGAQQQVLVDMNDNERRTFKTIANWIEAYL